MSNSSTTNSSTTNSSATRRLDLDGTVSAHAHYADSADLHSSEQAVMFATPMKLPKSRTLGVSFSELIPGRKLDDSSAGCPSTCNGRSCDQWEELFPAGTMTCELAEASYGCDCSGCDCNGRDGTAAPVPSPSTAPVPGPTAQPTETSVPTVFSTAMPTTLYNYKYKQCFDLYGAPYTAFPSFEPTRFDTPEPTMTPAPTVSLRPLSFVALGLPLDTLKLTVVDVLVSQQPLFLLLIVLLLLQVCYRVLLALDGTHPLELSLLFLHLALLP